MEEKRYKNVENEKEHWVVEGIMLVISHGCHPQGPVSIITASRTPNAPVSFNPTLPPQQLGIASRWGASKARNGVG